jgi:(2R)-sulfolactate sulfo-lyase subunit beta
MVTLCAASGYVVHLFPTGQGNVHRQSVCRDKADGKSAHRRTMWSILIRLLGPVTTREKSRPDRDELIEVMLRTCNGRLTAAEALGHREFVMTRLYESA